MSVFPDRMVIVFPIATPTKQRPAAASLQMLEITNSGAEFETLVPLDVNLIGQYANVFSVPLLIQRDELQLQLTEANANLADLAATIAEIEASRNAFRDGLNQATNTLQAIRQTLEETQARLDDKTRELAAKTELAEALLAQTQKQAGRIETLANSLPYNPRLIDAAAFVDRLPTGRALQLMESTDPRITQIADLLKLYRAENWPIGLDAPETQQAFALLVSIGWLTESERDNILRDATYSERHIPTNAAQDG